MPQGGLAIWHIDESAPQNTNPGYPGQAGWPYNGKHYKVALLQADGLYQLERPIGNKGDAGDLYRGDVGGVTAINLNTVPNTNAYQGGNVYPTGHQIDGIGASGFGMTFHFTSTTWVDFAFPGNENGCFPNPWRTLLEALPEVPTGGNLTIKAGSSSEKPTFSRAMFINSYNGLVIIGQ
jgi:hypothetical protein